MRWQACWGSLPSVLLAKPKKAGNAQGWGKGGHTGTFIATAGRKIHLAVWEGQEIMVNI